MIRSTGQQSKKIPIFPVRDMWRGSVYYNVRHHSEMTKLPEDLPIKKFASSSRLRAWLKKHHVSSRGIYLRIFKKPSGIPSVTFAEVLDEGLNFGWSESKRLKYDADSYLQKFTPRKVLGTHSSRNLARAAVLIEDGRMTSAGRRALGL